jgi:cellobiose-specific phosphotransferase system component IIA
MKKLMKKWEDIMVAITFAEAGEYDTAAENMGSGNEEIEEAEVALVEPESMQKKMAACGKIGNI